MFKAIVNHTFNQFDRTALSKKENEVLDGGIIKHISIIKYVAFFFPIQFTLAILAPKIMIVMTAVSFIALMLGTAWYAISFQNVSEAQLDAGVADFITKKMFRAFMLSFPMLIICVLVFIINTLIPELRPMIPSINELNLYLRLAILIANISWVILVAVDVYFASVAYDAADSLLGDGFPTLMRGAKANHINSPLVQLVAALVESQGIDAQKILKDKAKSEQ